MILQIKLDLRWEIPYEGLKVQVDSRKMHGRSKLEVKWWNLGVSNINIKQIVSNITMQKYSRISFSNLKIRNAFLNGIDMF